jgi:hypothetical protein
VQFGVHPVRRHHCDSGSLSGGTPIGVGRDAGESLHRLLECQRRAGRVAGLGLFHSEFQHCWCLSETSTLMI